MSGDILDVGSSTPNHDNANERPVEFECTIKDILPSREKPLCNSDIELLKNKPVIDALRNCLEQLPPSPHLLETELFKSILIPYKYYWNMQYSLAIEAWELLFEKIQEIDPDRFKTMHKGTPYYFCGIAAFKAKDYERAVFYFDAALHEDAKNYDELKKKHPEEITQYQDAPAALFLKLQERVDAGSNQVPTGIELTRQTKLLMEEALMIFYDEFKLPFNLMKLQEYFLKKAIEDENVEWRSAATALLSYVLESETRKKEFSLRSAHGGTMEPFFLHLFKGCLLFETLLKLSHQWPGGGLVTFYSDKKIRSALGVVNERSSEVKNKSIDDVVKVYNLWRSNSIPVNERVLWIAYGIRNATGHNLSSSAHDMTVDDFRNLSDDILFAIFLTISKLFTT